MADPIKIKMEKALVGYLGSLAGLSGCNFYRGIRGDKVALPSVTVDCVGLEPGIEAEDCDYWIARVNVVLKSRISHNSSGSSETAEGTHHTRGEVVAAALRSSAIREFCNSENEVNRPVSTFHIGRFLPGSEVYGWDPEEQAFMTMWQLRVPVQNTDGDA